MGKAVSMPLAAMAATTAAGRPKSENLGAVSPTDGETGSETGMETDKGKTPKVERVVLPGAGDPAALGMTRKKRQEAEQTMPLKIRVPDEPVQPRITRRASPIPRRSGSVRPCRRRRGAPAAS